MCRVHSQLGPSMKTLWEHLSGQSTIIGDMSRASLIDVISFVALADKTRRTLKKKWGELVSSMITCLRNSLALFMASCIKKEATRLCHAVPDIDSRAIPSRRCRSSGGASDMSTPGGHNSLVVFDPPMKVMTVPQSKLQSLASPRYWLT